VSSLNPDVPPVGEEIHLPGPSIKPLLLTLAITLALIGVTTAWVLTIAGGILTVVIIVAWIADTRRDIAELPLEHDHPH
jgi:hypothetical protein